MLIVYWTFPGRDLIQGQVQVQGSSYSRNQIKIKKAKRAFPIRYKKKLTEKCL